MEKRGRDAPLGQRRMRRPSGYMNLGIVIVSWAAGIAGTVLAGPADGLFGHAPPPRGGWLLNWLLPSRDQICLDLLLRSSVQPSG